MHPQGNSLSRSQLSALSPAHAGSIVRSGQAAAPPWLPDLGNGRYRNPVLFADYSDPDAIRVGDDFWLTSSSFCHVPGLPILHSHDLVNWTLVNHALPQLEPVGHFSSPRHGQGVWAPAIRHHAGRFWIFYPDPDFGIYVVTAGDPCGVWSPPVAVKTGCGLIDPCPFWDRDGAGYLVHGWAKSRSGINNRLSLHRLNADGTGVADDGQVIIDGRQFAGWHTLEGPKLYRRDDYYYIFAPAGGVAEGFQAVFRARHLYGPYEKRIVLAQGSTAINGPHQGAWIDAPDGTGWFLHFQEIPAYGRVVHLQPLRWRNDWPEIGQADHEGGPGEPVAEHPLPCALGLAPTGPAASDEFDSPRLARLWQWQGNPQPDWASLEARPGTLRLRCIGERPDAPLWGAAHLLLQKFAAPEFVATTLLEFAPGGDGDVTGLVVFGVSYAWLGLRCEHGRCRVVYCRCDDAHQGGREHERAWFPLEGCRVYLRVTVRTGARCEFAWSNDGRQFAAVGEEFFARSGTWVGAKFGLFASTRSGSVAVNGHADFHWFRVTSLSP